MADFWQRLAEGYEQETTSKTALITGATDGNREGNPSSCSPRGGRWSSSAGTRASAQRQWRN